MTKTGGVDMAVTFTIEMDKDAGTRAHLDEVRRLVGANGDDSMPPGMLAHLESETATGIRIVDVWETVDDFARFYDTALGAAFTEVGVQPIQGPPTVEPVINLLLRQRGSVPVQGGAPIIELPREAPV
jgi:hypothetical protein